MSQHDDRLYLGHMLDTARRVRARVSGLFRAEFDQNEDLQLALIRLLQIIGEAARHVSEPTRQAIPQLPWKRICAMRHRLVHDYVDVDLEIVWLTATGRMDEMITALEGFLKTP